MKRIKYWAIVSREFIKSIYRQITKRRVVLATVKGYNEPAKVLGRFVILNPLQAKRYKQKIGTKMVYVKWTKYHNGHTMIVPFKNIKIVSIKYSDKKSLNSKNSK